MDNAFHLNIYVMESPFWVMTVMIEVMKIGEIVVYCEQNSEENFPFPKNDRIGSFFYIILCYYKVISLISFFEIIHLTIKILDMHK